MEGEAAMSDSKWQMYSPNLISVCVNSAEGEEYSGQLWHQYDDNPIPFEGTLSMIKSMDNLYEEWDFPQKSTVSRSFVRQQEAVRRPMKPDLKPDLQRIKEKRGQLGTFVVYVKYRQNATWQGEILWVEEQEKQYFQSALELLKMIDGALIESTAEL
jgi:hypothetical protein